MQQFGVIDFAITFPILLDERLKFLHSSNESSESNEYIYKAYLFLRKVCEKLGEQIIFITGEEEFTSNSDFKAIANSTIFVKQKNGISYAEIK